MVDVTTDGVGRKGIGIHDIILVVSGPTEHILRSRKVVPRPPCLYEFLSKGWKGVGGGAAFYG